jgi:hypothetical protein
MSGTAARTGKMPHQNGGGQINSIESRENSAGVLISQSHMTAARLNDYKKKLNMAAVNIRRANHKLEKLETAVDRMKTSLVKFTKTYPPFSPGSEERVRILKSYASFRKQIRQLTIPPRDDYMSDTVFPSVKDQNKQSRYQVDIHPESVAINGQNISTDLPQYEFPMLAEDDGDETLSAIIPKLDAFTSAVGYRREKLAADVQFISFYPLTTHEVFSETDAHKKSYEISGQLARLSEHSMTSNPSSLKEVLIQNAA